MYARLVYVELSLYPRTREQVEDVLKTISSEVKGVKGMKGYTLFTDWDSGQVVPLSCGSPRRRRKPPGRS